MADEPPKQPDQSNAIAAAFAKVEEVYAIDIANARAAGRELWPCAVHSIEIEHEMGLIGLPIEHLPPTRRAVAVLVLAELRASIALFHDARTELDEPTYYRELARIGHLLSNATLHYRGPLVSVALTFPVTIEVPTQPPPGKN